MFRKIRNFFARAFFRWDSGRNKFRKIKHFVAMNESGVTVDACYKSGAYGNGYFLCEIAGERFVMFCELEDVGNQVYQVIYTSTMRKEGENLPVSHLNYKIKSRGLWGVRFLCWAGIMSFGNRKALPPFLLPQIRLPIPRLWVTNRR
jgi:hypothetical protein